SFPTNDGRVLIGGGWTLNTSTGTLTNSATGLIGGHGELVMGGATLHNNGTIAPGGENEIGQFTVRAGTVNFNTGSVLAIDLDGPDSDQLVLPTGTANFAPGVVVQLNEIDNALPGLSLVLDGATGGTLPAL